MQPSAPGEHELPVTHEPRAPQPPAGRGPLKSRLARVDWTFLLGFTAIFLAIDLSSEWFEHKFVLDAGEQPYKGTVVAATGLYQQLLTTPRQPVPRFTAIVELDAKTRPRESDSNVCQQRAMMAKLLPRIAQSQPAVIVIDKFYSPDACPENDAGTQAFIAAVRAVRQQVPLVVGQLSSDEAALPEDYLLPKLDFDAGEAAPDPGMFAYGVVNLAGDNRRLPLTWQLAANESQARARAAPEAHDTLALAAAKLWGTTLDRQNPKLQRLIDKGAQPFIGFMKPERFEASRYSVDEVFCGRKAAESGCGEQKLRGLRNRVVVIGENDLAADQKSTIVGPMLGLYVQANYIEALLDDRFFESAGKWVDLAFGVLFLFAAELVVRSLHGRFWRILGGLAVLIGLGWAIMWLYVMFFGRYIDPSIGALALFAQVGHVLYGLLPDRKSGNHRTPNPAG
jgi:CHASE2 domain-containing sensor protein